MGRKNVQKNHTFIIKTAKSFVKYDREKREKSCSKIQIVEIALKYTKL